MRALGWFAADLQIFAMFKLKFSSASIWTPKSFTDNLAFRVLLSIFVISLYDYFSFCLV